TSGLLDGLASHSRLRPPPCTASGRPLAVSILHRACLVVTLVTLIILGGSAGFHFIEGWSWFDGFYMTLTTMTTIGYGEIHPLSHHGRVFNSFLIGFSVLTGGFTISSFSPALFQFRVP